MAFLDSRLDLRFTTFARGQVPSTVISQHDRLCALEVPALDCEFPGAPDADQLWAALLSTSEVREMLNARHADALTVLHSIARWIDETSSLESILDAER